jgi:threonine synthase
VKYVSTRGAAPAATLSAAIRNGAAPDGGLYLPESVPYLLPDPALPLPAFAAELLGPFFEGDALAPALPAICAETFAFPVPIVAPDSARPSMRALELFHGPTGAFKDFGARFLTGCFDRIGEPLTILVATSGDTGGGVGCAVEGHANVRALILYPRGRISPFQARQLGCWGAPVQALELDGDFDDCQRLVKAAFADPALAARHRLTSANSINIGRLLPQMAYLAWAASRLFAETGVRPGLIVPTGNLGHGFVSLYARAMGLPIGPVRFATNANRTLADWARIGRYEPRPAIATLANAMDVGAPSNFERLAALQDRLGEVAVALVDDDGIRARIVADARASGYVWCPHSATAAEAYARLAPEMQAARPWLLCATAHPYKFAETVAPLIGRALDPPAALAAILDRPAFALPIPATLEALAVVLDVAEPRRDAAGAVQTAMAGSGWMGASSPGARRNCTSSPTLCTMLPACSRASALMAARFSGSPTIASGCSGAPRGSVSSCRGRLRRSTPPAGRWSRPTGWTLPICARSPGAAPRKWGSRHDGPTTCTLRSPPGIGGPISARRAPRAASGSNSPAGAAPRPTRRRPTPRRAAST